jgi:L-cystine uptake protein TcyP (sodium:dicarboxylate symporter family)
MNSQHIKNATQGWRLTYVISVGMQVGQQQILNSTDSGIFKNTDSSVNFVGKGFTQMLTMKGM